MKLIDILARELKVWPDHMTHLWVSSGNTIYGKNGLFEFEMNGGWDKPEDHRTVSVSRAEWQAAVDALNAPKVVAWDGVGDPPVGVVCQYSVLNGPWYTCEVGYSFFDGEHRCFVIKCKHLGFEQVCRIDPGSEGSVEFRPFRTAEQVAAEEREKAINEMMMHGVDAGDSTIEYSCAALYDAGYRKEPKPCGS